ncbi:threonylcarbamoyl-AMP synthase [Sphaerisporangium siamense]|uniref:L-threonylcarbamoyladenylate synthase n=1 Tax=Sphaerisporangium siamense TaxID=795645 RepID=A0A7W7DF90_9ACTN|nr:L-threonylcarbamoyladenylate synthase [Sphaerisporangium siamense]MBB4705662.1 tRNA threonylcarbamoyl adenosine modification protein (Sua5/YciO/YrdC/YwlC family) [Sphaerisporangium siamense]GII82954.1 threonylcarbamoyl-AMP synthase [Sphaerisporangium siamense]
MIRRYDLSNSEERAAGLADAAAAIRAGELVVLPTDTVYGLGADAFTHYSVGKLLETKGRGRDMPVPVLVGTVRAATALIEDLGVYGQDLIDAFWPGPLTLICKAGRSLTWDLGETKGTVAVRMPLHAVALELLKETGPMAVSSANISGAPPARTAAEAEAMLGEAVGVYLEAGPLTENVPSTILDLTTPVPRVLRKGAIPVDKLRAIVGYIATDADPEPEPETAPVEEKAPVDEKAPADEKAEKRDKDESSEKPETAGRAQKADGEA